MSRRPIALSALAIVLTMAASLAVRFAHLGLPVWLMKYGGSALWAMMIYWIASSVLPSWRIANVALIAASIATLVEFFKLYHTPALDNFRHTLAGALLLGRIFSLKDIAAYWVAVFSAAGVDRVLRKLVSKRA